MASPTTFGNGLEMLAGMAGRNSGSYLDRRDGWRAVAILG
jgi:hypothetical protein